MNSLPTGWLPITIIAVAPFVGSFLGVLIKRLPMGEPIMFGRSRCAACGHPLGPRDLVPFLSWAILRARCRYCNTPLGHFYPAIELLALMVAIWAALTVSGWLLLATATFGWLLLTLAAIDWRHFLLPNSLTAFVAVAGLVTAMLINPMLLPHHLAGMTAGYLTLTAIASVYKWLRGREGLGPGDAKFLGALGAWVSWEGITGILLLASIFALAVMVGRRVLGHPMHAETKIPLGTFLAAAGWIVWLYGPVILR